MANVGAPPKLTEEQKQEVYEALEQYILDTSDPTMPKFVSTNEVALQYNVTRHNLNDWPIFSTLIKRAVDKQESFLLEQGGSGKYNPTIAIFRLKQPQHGYTDKQERENTHKIVTPIMELNEVANAVLRDNSNQED